MLAETAIPDREALVLAPEPCVICKKRFRCPSNQIPRRETCGPECGQIMRRRKMKEGRIEYLSTRMEIRQFLNAAKKVGIGFYVAFQLAINAMLTIKDLQTIKRSDLKLFPVDEKGRRKPCVLMVDSAKVELDCESIAAVEDWCTIKRGPIFPISRSTFHRAFRETTRIGNVYEYCFPALRHTGIMLRAKEVKSLSDVEALWRDARFSSIHMLRPYLTAESSRLVERVRPVK